MADHIAGKSIIVTGAASGFGKLVAEKTAARGAKLVCADINGAGAEAVAAAIRDRGGAAIGQGADVTDLAQMQALAAAAVQAHGAIDVMINNAGVMPLAFFADHAKAAPAWHRCIDINIKGVLNGMLAVHDQMLAQGRGHVINISSIYGNFPVKGAAVYGASKAAVNFMSEALRAESQGKIKVTVVKPTGVPQTGLAGSIVNPAASVGIYGDAGPACIGELMKVFKGKADPEQMSPESIRYLMLAPEFIADAVLSVIDQPWGVVTSDITVRAAGDAFIL
jgi:NADP-dependent 3-hydroxy acid dehydrogenase YdfG